MDQDNYLRLIDRMNYNLARHPPTEKMQKVLQALFNEEQAELAGSFPLGAYTPKELSAKLNGDHCETTSPTKRCVWFGKAADYLAERGYATRLTKEECYTVFKKCEEAGLVRYASNYANADPVCICNCCKCYCNFLRQDRLFRQAGFETGLLETTNFRAQVYSLKMQADFRGACTAQ